MEVIAIATDATPTKTLGGPGRFAPLLFENLLSAPIEGKGFIGFFRDNLAGNVSEIKYSDNTKRSWLKLFLRGKLAIYASRYFIRTSKIKRSISSPKAIRILQKNNVKTIHAHDFSVVDRLRDFSGKIIFTNHYKGSLYKEYQRYQPGMTDSLCEHYYLEMERSAIMRADLITFPSQSAKNLLMEDHPELELEIENKSSIVYSGIDHNFIDMISPSNKFNKRVYLNVANHIPDKGIDIALKIFAEIRRYDSEAYFINVGLEGPETDNLKKISKILGIESSTKFLGVLPFSEVIGLMKSSFAMIHTPKRVVFDLTVLEAMAAGIPIIASAALGNIEALGNMHPLFLKNQSNSVDDIIYFLEDSSCRNHIINSQRSRLENMFTISAMVSRYLSIYENLPVFGKTLSAHGRE